MGGKGKRESEGTDSSVKSAVPTLKKIGTCLPLLSSNVRWTGEGRQGHAKGENAVRRKVMTVTLLRGPGVNRALQNV